MRLGIVVATLLVFVAGTAHADDWIVRVGVRTRFKPSFEGSAHRVLDPLPLISFRRADQPYRFTPPAVGASFSLIDTRFLVMGPVLRFRSGREAGGKYAGLAPISKALLPGAFLELWPKDWLRARIEARRSFNSDAGWSGDAGLDLIHTGMRWDASIGPRIGLGDGQYLQRYFGVTADEAAHGPLYRTPYAPGGGVRYTGVTAAAAYHWTRRWRTTLDVDYQRLAAKPMASPIVRAVGSGDQVSLGLSVSYEFGKVR